MMSMRLRISRWLTWAAGVGAAPEKEAGNPRSALPPE